jgi:1-aminocyclopropane-1-carboxylate deaminase
LQPDKIIIEKVLSFVPGYQKTEVSVLRLDKIHPLISGNKWFKLRYYLEEAAIQNKKHIVTFGGAWSNHIVATAAACQWKGFSCTGIIRGEEPGELSATLLKAKELGMELCFMSRDDYRAKKIPVHFQREEFYSIPEGGYGAPGLRGAATIADLFDHSAYTHVCCATGTGTMLAGLQTALACPVIGVSVLKTDGGLAQQIQSLLPAASKQVTVLHNYHFGGYARHTPELLEFMNTFYRQTGIPSDFVYTGKLFFAISDLLQKKFFPPESRLLLIHSGGLQGNASLSKDTLIF